VFLGDPNAPDTGIVELVQFDDAQRGSPPSSAPEFGFFLLSLQRDVDVILAALAELGFDDGVRRVEMPAPGGKTVVMAVITAPDGVRVELIGPPE
jgi:glyoxylase I family protein